MSAEVFVVGMGAPFESVFVGGGHSPRMMGTHPNSIESEFILFIKPLFSGQGTSLQYSFYFGAVKWSNQGVSVSNVVIFYIHHNLVVLVINFIADPRSHSDEWNDLRTIS